MPRKNEIPVHGRNACRALFTRRPEAILRVYVTRERAREFGELLRHCARRRLPYRVVPAEQVEAVSRSRHHEGICVVARPLEPVPVERLGPARGAACVLGLVGVANPHNIGAIFRTAAHFGAVGVLMVGGPARLSAATLRTAEGGAEGVPWARPDDPGAALKGLRDRGYAVYATSGREGHGLFQAGFPDRVAFLLGSEGSGLPDRVLREADQVVRIPGTGWVESLNVATAAGVLLAEWWRRHGPERKTTAPEPPRAGSGAVRKGGRKVQR